MPPSTRSTPAAARPTIRKSAFATKTINEAKRLLPSRIAKLNALERNLANGSSAQLVWDSTISILSSCLRQIKSLQLEVDETNVQNSEMRAVHETGDFIRLYLQPFSSLAMQKEGLRIGDYFEMWESLGGFYTRNDVTKDIEARILSVDNVKLRY